MVTYSLVLLPEADGSGYTVEVPALPGVVTFGATKSEAITMAREAIELYLETARDHGWPVAAEHQAPEIVPVQIQPPAGLRPAV